MSEPATRDGGKNGRCWSSNLLLQLQYTPNCRPEYPLIAGLAGEASVPAGTEFHRVKDPQNEQERAPPDAGV
jgi:hypothetical protein